MPRRQLLLFPVSLLLASCALLPKSGDDTTPTFTEGEPVLTSSVDSETPDSETPPTAELPPAIEETTPTDAPVPTAPIEAPATEKPNFFVGLWQKVFPPKPEGPPAATAPNWVGTVKAISARHDYVLVDTLNYQNPVPGAILTTVGAESETGSVRVSDDRDPPFFIADVISGSPAPGDRLYSPAQ